MYKFYPVLNHVAYISAQSVVASVAIAVMGQSSTPASSVPQAQPTSKSKQPLTKPISSKVQVTQKRPVEEQEQEQEPPAKQCLTSKQGR